MSTCKQLLIDQMELILSTYSPYEESLGEKEKKDCKEISQCLEILKKDNG